MTLTRKDFDYELTPLIRNMIADETADMRKAAIELEKKTELSLHELYRRMDLIDANSGVEATTIRAITVGIADVVKQFVKEQTDAIFIRLATLEEFAQIAFAGDFKPDKTYLPRNVVVHANRLWCAVATTKATPGRSGDWTLLWRTDWHGAETPQRTVINVGAARPTRKTRTRKETHVLEHDAKGRVKKFVTEEIEDDPQ